MNKALIYLAILFAGMLIAGTFDAQTAELESQPNTTNKWKTPLFFLQGLEVLQLKNILTTLKTLTRIF